MIIQCSKCGIDIERTSNIKNAVCFDCKRIRDKKNYLKNKPDREVQGVGKRNKELYNISWEEIRRRLIPIDKESDLRKLNKKLKHKLYA